MGITAQHDFVLLERQITETDSEFVTKGIEEDSPFFVVIDGREHHYIEGEVVIPHPHRLLEQTMNGKKVYWVDAKDIMGTVNGKAK